MIFFIDNTVRNNLNNITTMLLKDLLYKFADNSNLELNIYSEYVSELISTLNTDETFKNDYLNINEILETVKEAFDQALELIQLTITPVTHSNYKKTANHFLKFLGKHNQLKTLN